MGGSFWITTLDMFFVLLLTPSPGACRLQDDLSFVEGYFETRSQRQEDEVCTDRMKSCIPWENECCKGLKCTNYGGRQCDYGSEMCVCSKPTR